MLNQLRVRHLLSGARRNSQKELGTCTLTAPVFCRCQSTRLIREELREDILACLRAIETDRTLECVVLLAAMAFLTFPKPAFLV